MQKPKLLDQVRNLMRLRHLSHKTERAYISYIREFILFHDKRNPNRSGTARTQRRANDANLHARLKNKFFVKSSLSN